MLAPFLVYEGPLLVAVQELLREGRSAWIVAIAIVLLLASDVVLPVPSSLVATASGGLLGLLPGALVAWTGMQAGVLVGYGVGRAAGFRAARRIVGRKELRRASRSHRRWGSWSLVVSRAVPVLAEGSVVLAGTVRMPLGPFVGLTALSNAAISGIYAGIGAYAFTSRAFLAAFGASVVIPGIFLLIQRRFGSIDPSRASGGPASGRRA